MGSTLTSKISEGGRVVIPAEIRRQLGLEAGDTITLSVVDQEIRIISRTEALRRAQALVRKRVTKGCSLVAELREERRREAANESVCARRLRRAGVTQPGARGRSGRSLTR